MEARLAALAIALAALLSLGASYRTNNFVVTANSPRLAQEVAIAAETFRRDLAILWLGDELENWREPCPIRVTAQPGMPAGGETSFYFTNGQPHGWEMIIQGSRERVLDSVLPHEVTHTIFATHFGCPLPRWADEGACTTVEHPTEKRKHDSFLVQFLKTDRGIAFNQMFAMTDYPSDILPLYSQGYSLARFLIDQGGHRKFVQYVEDGLRGRSWTAATRKHYGYKSLSELQVTWLNWVRRGSPALPKQSDNTMLASHTVEPDEQTAPAADQPLTQLVPLNSQESLAAALPTKELPSRVAPSHSSVADSWYARQRDLAYAARAASRNQQSRSTDGTSDGISHSRPPGIERAGVRILQPSKAAPVDQ